MTYAPPPAAQPRRRSTKKIVAIAVSAALVAVIAVGAIAWQATDGGFTIRDPNGARACSALSDWLDGGMNNPATGKPTEKIDLVMAVSDFAAEAGDPGIRAAVADIGDTGLAAAAGIKFTNLEHLHAACRDAGVSMPDYVEPN